jgi:hypothetical protein
MVGLVLPVYFIVSFSYNNHPTQDTLENLQTIGLPLWARLQKGTSSTVHIFWITLRF